MGGGGCWKGGVGGVCGRGDGGVGGGCGRGGVARPILSSFPQDQILSNQSRNLVSTINFTNVL